MLLLGVTVNPRFPQFPIRCRQRTNDKSKVQTKFVERSKFDDYTPQPPKGDET